MLGWILDILGFGGVAVLVVGFLMRLGFFAFVPGAIANFIGYVLELILRLFSWFGETFLTGESNIWSTWQGAAAQLMVVVVCMMIGSGPLLKVVHWSPFHHTSVAVAPANDDAAEDAEQDAASQPTRAAQPVAKSGTVNWKRAFFPKAAKPAQDDGSFMRNPLGTS